MDLIRKFVQLSISNIKVLNLVEIPILPYCRQS